MNVIAIDSKETKPETRTALALGNFDGMHIGHKSLINSMVYNAKKLKLTPSVLTFDANFSEFKLGANNNVLMSLNQKEDFLKDMDVQNIYMIKFDDDFMRISPQSFVEEVIVKRLNAEFVVVGYNFRFGYKAEGDVILLEELSKRYNFKLEIIPPIELNNALVSSTKIRELIKQGQIIEANKLLDRNYTIRGKVISGMGRGKGLGFATANLKVDTNYTMPKIGVYKTITNFNKKRYLSITNIGYNPTFADVGFSIETHILDFNLDIYDSKIDIEFLDFIRGEVKFNSIQELINQVNSDIQTVKSAIK